MENFFFFILTQGDLACWGWLCHKHGKPEAGRFFLRGALRRLAAALPGDRGGGEAVACGCYPGVLCVSQARPLYPVRRVSLTRCGSCHRAAPACPAAGSGAGSAGACRRDGASAPLLGAVLALQRQRAGAGGGGGGGPRAEPGLAAAVTFRGGAGPRVSLAGTRGSCWAAVTSFSSVSFPEVGSRFLASACAGGCARRARVEARVAGAGAGWEGRAAGMDELWVAASEVTSERFVQVRCVSSSLFFLPFFFFFFW